MLKIVSMSPEFVEDVVSIHCPRWRELTLEYRLKECGYWGDPRIFSWYLEALYSAGGKVIVALDGDDVVGEAEVVPERFPTPVGKHAYLQMVWVKREARRAGVGRALVRECESISKNMGLYNLDTIPTREAAPFFLELGFKEVESQILMEARSRPTPEQPKVEEATREEFPASAQMIAGQTRPSSFLWELLWEREEIGLPSPRVVKVRVGMWQLIVALFQPTKWDDHLYTLIWAPMKAGLGQIFNSAEVSLTLAYEMGIEKVRTQTWCKYRAAFEGAGFEPITRLRWMRKGLNKKVRGLASQRRPYNIFNPPLH